jgi:hypothetical protein
MLFLIQHAVVVGGLDVVVSSLHVVHLITASVRLTRHVVDDVGVAAAHAVGCKAARVRQAMRLMLMRRGNLLGRRDLRKRVLRCDCVGVGGRGLGRLRLALSDSAGLSTALDTLVAVLVVGSKVLKELTLGLGDLLSRVEDLSEPHGEVLQRLLVEVVLVGLQ